MDSVVFHLQAEHLDKKVWNSIKALFKGQQICLTVTTEKSNQERSPAGESGLLNEPDFSTFPMSKVEWEEILQIRESVQNGTAKTYSAEAVLDEIRERRKKS